MGVGRRYRTIRTVGQGAGGEVSLVADELQGGRQVALKRIAGDMDEASCAALAREFSTLASLSLPGVARVYDFGLVGESDHGEREAFFTRGFIDGRPLDVAARDLSTEQCVRLFGRVASRVRALHAAGVVHGDIKPANVIIDADGAAHLIDFGLASVSGSMVGAVGGTPAFMAPELFDGARPSTLSDVYALGCTLWILLIGSPPVADRGARRSSGARASDRPTVPSAMHNATGQVLAVAQRAASRDPSDRFPSVGEFLAALDRVIPSEAAAVEEWVAPRARGHKGFTDTLRGAVDEAGARGGSVLVAAPAGGGKTTLLRSIKWHCQLRGWPVVELIVRSGQGLAPAASLLEQATLLASEGASPKPVMGSAVEWADACVAQLSAIDSQRPILILVDDLDRAEGVVAELLRLVVRNERQVPVVVLASAQELGSPAVRELCPDTTFHTPPLTEADVGALTVEALGPTDETVLRGLYLQSGGLPGTLVPALRALSTSIAPTLSDVEQLDVHGLADERARRDTEALPLADQQLLVLLDVVAGPTTLASLSTWLGVDSASLATTVERLTERGVLRLELAGVRVADVRVARVVRQRIGLGAIRRLARAWLTSATDPALDVVTRARLALAAGDREHAAGCLAPAVAILRQTRAYMAAIELLRSWCALLGDDVEVGVLATLANLYAEAGDVDESTATGLRILDDARSSVRERAQAAVLVARGLSARAEFSRALAVLDNVPPQAEAESLARGFRERAKIHLLRGDYADVALDAQRGLDVAGAADLVRVELLTSLGMAASYLGDQEGARARYEEALALARSAGSKRDIANAIAYLAIANVRDGDVSRARDLFAESLGIARDLGDVGGMSNFSLSLGAMEFYLGRVGSAAENYTSAIKLARRAGRASTALQARNNLAHIHIYFGLFEQARAEAEAVVVDASQAGLRMIEAQATVLIADLHARAGEVDLALVRYEEALRVYSDLGQQREVADVHLDAAEAILDRGGPADPSAAAARLAAARALIDAHALTDYRLRLALLLCRARVGSGEGEGAVAELQSLIEEAREKGARDILWNAYVAAAHAHEALGASFRARHCDQQAVEVLEEIALQVPREHREAFWSDPRRREARRRAALSATGVESTGSGAELRRDRLLEIIKHLASEHDLDRLLDRITESAVELSGAERGFVLLVGADGALEKRTERRARDKDVDPHAAFSRSIAEAVLIDGEPIVTVDASLDRRVNDYLSVHRLMLRSLACLPISGRSGTVGVLYLEHRRQRGRFGDTDIDVLHALADQAAIALENARLIADAAARRDELEIANAALMRAKSEIEALLVARTDELEVARAALDDARIAPPLDLNRHGMIGRSASMRRVFETIDRLATNDVPVAILGESGTGKELVARAIHRAGTRASSHFIAVNCGAIPETLIESELFGHVRGAFTGADRDKLGLFARASGGTLFLDEVSEMSPKMQIDLLRVVQERTIRPVGSEHDVAIDVRFITASNRALDELVSEKRFREDLYYRLTVVQVGIAPLRQRREDIPLLCEHFLRSFAKREGKPSKRLSPDAIDRLCAHPLPGNVRQLEHLLLNAWVLVDGTVIRGDQLALDRDTAPSTHVAEPATDSRPQAASIEEYREQERLKILEALEQHGWNRVQAAAALGIPRRTFYRRLSDYGIL